jgi:hypothetical protein
MIRKTIGLVLLASVFIQGTAFAQTTAAPARPRSSTKRVVWTILGAGAGFGAGMFFGLNKFDDSINSDRKVWTSAILGAAGGALAGGLLSRNRKRGLPSSALQDPSRRTSTRSALPFDSLEPGRIEGSSNTLGEVKTIDRIWAKPRTEADRR